MNTSLLHWICSNLDKIRDGIFLCITLIYASGYFTWAMISKNFGLGSLSVFDVQYFIAGFPLFVAFLFTIFAIRILRKITFYFWPKYYSKQKTKIQIFISIIISLLSLLFTVFLTYVFFTYSKDELSSGLLLVLFFTSAIFTLVDNPHIFSTEHFKSLMTNKSGQSNTKKDRLQKQLISEILIQKIFTAYLIPLILLIIGIKLFIFTVYPKIPQEFGGAKPQYAYFDISKNNFSYHTLSKLLNANDLIKDEMTLRSKRLKIYFSSDKSFYVGVVDSTDSTSKIIEISRQTINGICWISEE